MSAIGNFLIGCGAGLITSIILFVGYYLGLTGGLFWMIADNGRPKSLRGRLSLTGLILIFWMPYDFIIAVVAYLSSYYLASMIGVICAGAVIEGCCKGLLLWAIWSRK